MVFSTFVPTAFTPPTITAFLALRDLIAEIILLGRKFFAESNKGALLTIAAGPAESASAKSSPLVRKMVSADEKQ